MAIQYLKIIIPFLGFFFGVCGNFTDIQRDSRLLKFSKFAKFALPFAPLTVVLIPNEKCNAGENQFGTCMAKTECKKKNGTFRGICGQGFGVCCIMIAVENGTAYGNNTLIYKSAFNEGVNITYTILRMNRKICQFRIDVVSLILSDVPSNGLCVQDYMTVNQDTKFKRVCGRTKNVHYYFDVANNTVQFNFYTDPTVSVTRNWEMYVSQYTCDMGAPTGCGQWYWGKTGLIEIWNNINPAPNPWYYLDNQVYGICVRWEAGYCTITYSETIRFQPKCNDIFERPGNSLLQAGCIPTPPTTSIVYTFNLGEQIFYVQFLDNTNTHIGTSSNPFKNPSISYTQNAC